MPLLLTRGRGWLLCALALVPHIGTNSTLAQYPKPLVPGSENIVLGAFVLRHPDVLAELKMDSKTLQSLHAELELQVREAGDADRQQGLTRRPLTAEQAQTLNWLLLDSLSPMEGNRLIQLLNRHTVVLAQKPHNWRIVALPIPAFAHRIQLQLRLAPQASDALDQLFESSYAVFQKRLEEYHASVNEALEEFLENAHAKLDEGTKAQLAALVGTSIGEPLWPQNTRPPRAEDILRRLQSGQMQLFPELWFEDSKSAMAVGPALNTLVYFLADNEELAQRELDLTPAQMELIAHAAAIGRAPLPTNSEGPMDIVDRMRFLASESHLQFRQQSFIRDEFLATLQPGQLSRFRELVNQVVVGDLPVTWLAFDSRVRRRLDIDGNCINRLDEAQKALAQTLDKIKSEFRDDCSALYRRTEQEALATLTVAQREQYQEWFGALFVFENPTWRTILGLINIRDEATRR